MAGDSCIIAKLLYLTPDSESPAFHVGAPGVESRWIGHYSEVEVEIRNARALAREPTLEAEGFCLIRHQTRDVDFWSDRDVEANYYPQIAGLIRGQMAADDVVVFDHTVRIDEKRGGVRGAVRHVHNDYSAASVMRRVIDLVGGDEAVSRFRDRFAQVNVWRPFGGLAERSPLALADARSFDQEDFVKADIIYAHRRGEVLEVVYRPSHRWFYYPAMSPDEALLFRGYDSGEEITHRFTAHTAFDDPNTPAAAPPRKSIEVRAIAFFDGA